MVTESSNFQVSQAKTHLLRTRPLLGCLKDQKKVTRFPIRVETGGTVMGEMTTPSHQKVQKVLIQVATLISLAATMTTHVGHLGLMIIKSLEILPHTCHITAYCAFIQQFLAKRNVAGAAKLLTDKKYAELPKKKDYIPNKKGKNKKGIRKHKRAGKRFKKKLK